VWNGKCDEKLGQQILIQNLGNFYFVVPMLFVMMAQPGENIAGTNLTFVLHNIVHTLGVLYRAL